MTSFLLSPLSSSPFHILPSFFSFVFSSCLSLTKKKKKKKKETLGNSSVLEDPIYVQCTVFTVLVFSILVFSLQHLEINEVHSKPCFSCFGNNFLFQEMI